MRSQSHVWIGERMYVSVCLSKTMNDCHIIVQMIHMSTQSMPDLPLSVRSAVDILCVKRATQNRFVSPRSHDDPPLVVRTPVPRSCLPACISWLRNLLLLYSQCPYWNRPLALLANDPIDMILAPFCICRVLLDRLV